MDGNFPDTYAGYSQHSYETQNLPNDNLKAEEILKFRDEGLDEISHSRAVPKFA